MNFLLIVEILKWIFACFSDILLSKSVFLPLWLYTHILISYHVDMLERGTSTEKIFWESLGLDGLLGGNDVCLGGRTGIPGRKALSLFHSENSCQHCFGVSSKFLFLTHRMTCDEFVTLLKILFCSPISWKRIRQLIWCILFLWSSAMPWGK